jgi:hypothetical protein
LAKTTRLRNETAVEQSIFVGGRRHIIGPKAEITVEETLAKEFLMQCGDLVREVLEDESIGGVYEDAAVAQTVWLANFTGNPDAPKTIKRRKKLGKGDWAYVDEPNPVAEPMDVVRSHDGGMEEYATQDGPMGRNLGPIEIRVPRYQRRQLPKPIANWCLNREANNRLVHSVGARLRLSRAPSAFEPNMTWELDDIRCYLEMMDRSAVLGPSEKDLAVAEDKDLALRDARELCMRRLHFRLADLQYRLITRKEFDAYRANFEKPKAPEPKVEAKHAKANSSTGASAQ